MKFIFIGGVPRSGTSMVQKILSNHSQIQAGPEFDHIPAIMKLYRACKSGIKNGRQSYYYNSIQLKESFSNLIFSLLDNNVTEDVSYVSEKTPANALVFDEIADVFMDCKLILVVRDPRAIISSMREVYVRSLKQGIKVNVGKSILNDIRLLESYFISMDRSVKRLKERVKILYYEDIVLNPEKQFDSLFKELNVNSNLDLLENLKENPFHQLKKNQTSKSWYTGEMNNRKITKEGLNKYRNNLNSFEIKYIEHYFASNRYEILKRYNFSKYNKLKSYLLRALIR